MRRVEVHWLDSTSYDGWRSLRSVKRDHRVPQRCLSVGLIVKRDRHGITLAGSIHDHEVCQTIHIPKGAIRKVRRLR